MKKYLSMALVLSLALFVGCTKKEVVVETTDPVVSTAYTVVTSEDVLTSIDDENSVLVDARESAGFNGWMLNEEARGGHITGATLFSAKWIDLFEDDSAIEAELNKFGIAKDKNVTTYGYGDDAITLANKLIELGYTSVLVYEGGIAEWTNSSDLSVSAMDNYEYLVTPAMVNDLVKGKSVPSFNGKDIKIIEASWGPGDNYVKGHIPGATHINTDEYEVGPLWNRVSDEEILAATLANGITKDTTVVLYGSDTTPAARIALMLRYLGVEDVRLLDGGYQAWKASGFDIATGGVEKTPVTDFGTDVTPVNPGFIIDMPEAKEILANDNSNLISIRSVIEFTGETSGYDYIEAAGRIEGAVYGYAGSDPWHMEDYRNIDNTMINYEYMTKRWEENGILSSNENSFYCGTGWRAAETWFYSKALGWEKSSLYDGGWKEWSETPGNPVATGDYK